MTKLQKALKEKAVLERKLASESRWAKTYLEKTLLLERALEMAGNYIYGETTSGGMDRCEGCPLTWGQCGNDKCSEAIAAHFKAEAEKGGY